jgi:hypothetical protein
MNFALQDFNFNCAYIILIIVIARMTWLLQPCDTHAFHRFKLELRSLILAERARAVNGSFGAVSFFDCLFNAVRRVLQGVSWSRAFDDDGYACFQASTSTYVRRVLELPCQHAAPCTPLSEEDLRPHLSAWIHNTHWCPPGLGFGAATT